MISISINKKKYEAEEGQTILLAARQNDIYIPSLCFHEKTGILSKCRACVVEIEGISGLTPACSTPVQEGMSITTNSQKVLETQRLVIELLLSAGTHNCAVCQRYGTCELQDAAYYLGIELDMTGPSLSSPMVSWFSAPYWNESHSIGPDDKPVNPAELTLEIDDTDECITVNHDRCISCGRCIQACQTAGPNVIHFANRGHRTRIIFDNDVSLGSSSCDHCMACLQVCPVGCLVEKNNVVSAESEKYAAIT